jgi:small conductance mechanosensitive channel
VCFAIGETLVARIYDHLFQHRSSASARLILILVLAALTHLLVKSVSLVSEKIIALTQKHRDRFTFVTQQPKVATLVRLLANTLTWTIYFVAIGLVLEECGVNLTAYLASASVIALAISFGSQGLVQDMVIGLTLIFSDAIDVDDMVEIVGSAVVVGRVQEIGLRFIKIVNLYDQIVFIPNRTVANVSRYPHGGIYAYADIQFPAGVDREKATQVITAIARSMWKQFGAIVVSEPIINPVRPASEGTWDFLRVRFVIWPGQGNLIETTFRQHVLKAMRAFDDSYAEWQITVLYRASGDQIAAPPHHTARPTQKSTARPDRPKAE